MKTFVCCLTLSLCALTAAGQAQSLMDAQRDSILSSHRVIAVDSDGHVSSARQYNDSIRAVIAEFYYDQFRSFYDPEAPYFLFMSRDASLAMGIGGAVRMRGYFDWHGAMPSPGFAPYMIPMNPGPADLRHFGTTPSGTCLFFRVIGRNKQLGHYQLYIEANFTGYDSRDFKLKKAYAQVRDFTIGYDVTTFSDPAALPPMVDSQGPANKIAPANVLVRYMPRLSERWVLAVSAETPKTAIGGDASQVKAIQNWIPDAAAFIQYEWGPTNHVRLAGIVRSLSYRDLVNPSNHHRAGWGVALSTVNHPNRWLTTYISANYGHGYASMGGDLAIGPYDLIANPDRPGRLYSPATLGYCVGVQWNFRPNLFVSASVSQTHLFAAKAVEPSEYKRGIKAAVNCFWNLTPRIQVGIEYDWGQRVNHDGEHRHTSRIGAMTMFSF